MTTLQRLLIASAAGVLLGLGCQSGGTINLGNGGGVIVPADIAYSQNPATYTLGMAIQPNVPGAVGTGPFSVTPALPAGLLMNNTTGVISGTPTALSPTATYTVTSGTSTTSLVLTVNDVAPSNLAYPPQGAFLAGLAIAPVTPTVSGGAVVTYSVTPNLPAGLVLDAATGVLSGTPMVPTPSAAYHIVATNSGGSAPFDLTLSVLAPPLVVTSQPANASVTLGGSATFTVGAAGIGPLTYQWFRNGAAINGANGASYQTPPAVQADALSTYAAQVSDSFGTLAVSNAATLTVTAAAAPRFLYTANSGENTVSIYLVEPGTGRLQSLGYQVMNGGAPTTLALTPDFGFLLVLEPLVPRIESYRVDPNSGQLTLVNSQNTGPVPTSMAIRPDGRFVYITDNTGVTVVAIDPANGTLTPASSASASPFTPNSVAIDPRGQFAYVAAQDGGGVGTLCTYSISGADGSLALQGALMAPNPALTLAIHPAGTFVYVASAIDAATGAVSAYAIDGTTGLLTPVGPATPTGGTFPVSLALDPTGTRVYVANNGSNDLSAMAIQADGTLAPGAAVAVGNGPVSVVLDPTGTLAFVANMTSSDVSALAIPGLGTPAQFRTRLNCSSIAVSGGATPLAKAPASLYVAADSGATTGIFNYTISQANGALSPTAALPVAMPGGPNTLAMDPLGRFLCSANGGVQTVSTLPVGFDGSLGAPVHSQPQGSGIYGIDLDPSGRFAFVAQPLTGMALEFSCNGVGLTANQTPAAFNAPAFDPFSVAVDPTGRFVYMGNRTNDKISLLTYDPVTGAMTAGADTAITPASSISAVAVHPSGRFLYATAYSTSTLLPFAIDAATGGLTPLAPLPTGTAPYSLALHPRGTWAYVANSSPTANKVTAFDVDPATGALANPRDFGGAGGSAGVTVDPSGNFLYTISADESSVGIFKIDPASGDLVPLPDAVTGMTNIASMALRWVLQ